MEHCEKNRAIRGDVPGFREWGEARTGRTRAPRPRPRMRRVRSRLPGSTSNPKRTRRTNRTITRPRKRHTSARASGPRTPPRKKKRTPTPRHPFTRFRATGNTEDGTRMTSPSRWSATTSPSTIRCGRTSSPRTASTASTIPTISTKNRAMKTTTAKTTRATCRGSTRTPCTSRSRAPHPKDPSAWTRRNAGTTSCTTEGYRRRSRA